MIEIKKKYAILFERCGNTIMDFLIKLKFDFMFEWIK